MAPSLSSAKPTMATKCANNNETSLTIRKDGSICWKQFLSNETAPEDKFPLQLNDILKGMGVKNLSADEQTEMIRKYNSSFEKLNVSKDHNPPKLEDMLQLMKEWSPKTDLIRLHVRWSKKSPRNFGLDTLSTLLTVSHQCGLSPLQFLMKAKTLVIHPRSSRNAQGKFGVRFVFLTVNSKNVDGEMISRQFAGLALTLYMLQSAVVGCRGTIGKVGMRQSVARTPSLISVADDDDSEEPVIPSRGFLGIPMLEFHKESSLHHRLWLNIGHRWMALQLVIHLFKPHITPWTPRDALEYTFRMHSGDCVSRHDFLNPLVGFCLRFSNLNIIEANPNSLTRYWREVNLFSSTGNTVLREMSLEMQRDEIFLTFVELQDCPKLTYSSNRLVGTDKQWLMLRGYIYHYWLESSTNQELLASVVDSLKKRNMNSNLHPNDLSPVCCEPERTKKKARIHLSITPLSTEDGAHLLGRRLVTRNRDSSGYMSLLSSRQIPSGVFENSTAVVK
jgi:hypothetical protein